MVRAGSGWQTLLADLSIILFMVTASAVSMDDTPSAKAESAAPASQQAASQQAEPLAVWRAGDGAPPLAQWLTAQSPDPRQQLTITAFYAPGGRDAALAQVDVLARQAGEAGTRVRIVVEPGSGGTTASLAYDTPDTTLAQGLLANPATLAIQGNAR